MNYEEQLQISQLNKEIQDKIIATVNSEDFINYYIYHSQKETLEYYNIRNIKQLIKILTIFNYDFSKPKPSKFKGKKSARSHDSYITGGKKSAETQKQAWENKSEEEKLAWSTKQKAAHSVDSFKQQIRQININYQANLTEEEKNIIRQKKAASNKQTWGMYKKDILEKAYETKTKNNSWNTSKPEDNYYIYLLTKFKEEDILRQYKDLRYPHACDFYIKSLDLFIELNFDWTHGLHKFDNTSLIDLKKLESWKQKATESKFYKKAIETWTILDISKFNDAENNNLNYLVFYSEAEAYNYEF